MGIALTDEGGVFFDCWGDVQTTSVRRFGGPRLGGGGIGERGCGLGVLGVM